MGAQPPWKRPAQSYSSCAVKEIRENYPSEDGKYIPFMESKKMKIVLRMENNVYDMHTFFL